MVVLVLVLSLQVSLQRRRRLVIVSRGGLAAGRELRCRL